MYSELLLVAARRAAGACAATANCTVARLRSRSAGVAAPVLRRRQQHGRHGQHLHSFACAHCSRANGMIGKRGRRNFQIEGRGTSPRTRLAAVGPNDIAGSRNYHVSLCRGHNFSGAVFAPHGVPAVLGFGDEEEYDDIDEEEEDQHAELSQSHRQRKSFVGSSRYPASLDLELGEGYGEDGLDPWDHGDEGDYDSDDARANVPFSDRPKRTNTSGANSRRRSAVELLMHFDPIRPPVSDDPDDLQLWLECEAQQEAVLRYQKAMESARERKDYSSLSLVQRQVLRWYPLLRKKIAERQRQYMLKDGEQHPTASGYGPFLCALPPAKLAVIVAHEAIMCTLLKSGLHGKEGVPFATLASRSKYLPSKLVYE